MRRFIALLLAVTVLSACTMFRKPGLDPNTVAEVNDKPITQAEVVTRAKIFELFFKEPIETPSSNVQFIDQIIVERLILEQAGKMGITVTDEQVETEMNRFYDSLARQYPSREEMNKQVQTLGLTNEDIAAFLRDFLLTQQVTEKKRAEVTVTDAEVQAFYEQNRGTLYTFDQDVVRAAHILLPPDQEAQAREVAAKAQAGGDFAELARVYSVDPVSNQFGGDLGFFTRNTMVKPFADAAFSLSPGSVSAPVQSEFGWHVIKVLDKAGTGVLSFERVRDDAAHKLLPQKQEVELARWVESLEGAAHIEKAPLASK